MRFPPFRPLIILPLLLLWGGLQSSAATEEIPISVFVSALPVAPGEELLIAVVFEIPRGLHINSDRFQALLVEGHVPFPTSVRVLDAPEWLSAGEVWYPEPERMSAAFAKGEISVWSGQVTAVIPARISGPAGHGSKGRLRVEAAFQACDEKTCFLPEKRTLETELTVGPASVPAPGRELFSAFLEARASANRVSFGLLDFRFTADSSSTAGLLLILLAAAIGGMLLNFTPCVLPVIPIKMLSLSRAAATPGRAVTLGAVMSAGIVAFWLGLGAVISSASGLVAANQLFQFPAFTISTGVVIAVMAVGMGGFFSVRVPDALSAIAPRPDGIPSVLLMGVMTAVLSTPCTAPFMGAAAAWAAGKSPAMTLATFSAIGLGMAAPYFALSFFPGLARKMPKAGEGSVLLKEILGILLLAAAAYFIGSGLAGLIPAIAPIYGWGPSFFCALAGLRLAWRSWIIAKGLGRAVFPVAGLLLAGISLAAAPRVTSGSPGPWKDYSGAAAEEARRAGKVIVLDFTAEWCLNCKTLEHGPLASEKVIALLADGGVAAFRVDLTAENPEGRAMLRRAGRLTIPLLVIEDSRGRELFKEDFFTAEQLRRALLSALSR